MEWLQEKKNDSKNDSKNDGKSDTKMIRKTCAFFQSHKNNLLFSHQTILVISVRNKACIFFFWNKLQKKKIVLAFLNTTCNAFTKIIFSLGEM